MTNNQTNNNLAKGIRRLIAALILSAAPLLIAIDSATVAHADSTVSTPDPSFNAPTPHPTFPLQTDRPSPGTPSHHHHQHHGGK